MCKRWYDDLFPTFYSPMPAVCYKTVLVGSQEVMSDGFVENYNPYKSNAEKINDGVQI